MEAADTHQNLDVGAVSQACLTLEIGSCTNILRECRTRPPVCRWSDTRSFDSSSGRRKPQAAACTWVSSKGAALSASQPHLACPKHVGPLFAAIGLDLGGSMQVERGLALLRNMARVVTTFAPFTHWQNIIIMPSLSLFLNRQCRGELSSSAAQASDPKGYRRATAST